MGGYLDLCLNIGAWLWLFSQWRLVLSVNNPSSSIEDMLQSSLSSWPKCQNDFREREREGFVFFIFSKKSNFPNIAWRMHVLPLIFWIFWFFIILHYFLIFLESCAKSKFDFDFDLADIAKKVTKWDTVGNGRRAHHWKGIDETVNNMQLPIWNNVTSPINFGPEQLSLKTPDLLVGPHDTESCERRHIAIRYPIEENEVPSERYRWVHWSFVHIFVCWVH